MSVFHHPHLTRGIVNTSKGSFVIVRGLVEVPDEIGEALGWRPVDVENDPRAAPASVHKAKLAPAANDVEASTWSPPPRKTDREARARMIRAKALTLRSRLNVQPNE
jgi:hypothetical protein